MREITLKRLKENNSEACALVDDIYVPQKNLWARGAKARSMIWMVLTATNGGGNMTYSEALSVAVGFLDLASGMGFFEDGEIELIDAAIEVLYEKGKAFNDET